MSLIRDEKNRRLACVICFETVGFDDLYVDDAGDSWDMCERCGEREKEATDG